MPDQPYTTADLRAEAARQHLVLTLHPDYMGVGERMDGAQIASLAEAADDDDADGITWDSLSREQFDTAQGKIAGLIEGAADLSDWAVNIGADGLQPTGHVLSVGAGERTIARIHFAFEPGMDDDVRTGLIEGVGQAIADAL